MGRIRRERWPVRIYSMNELAAMLGCTNRYDFSAAVPHCCLIAVVGAAAGVPWIRWQFSLRTLLIVMTLVAVVLGIRAASI